MNPGELNKRIIIQDQNLETEEWFDKYECWASVNPIAGREFYDVEKIDSGLSHRVRMRYKEGILPSMRIVFKGRVLHIESVINDYEKNSTLQLMCREVV